MGAQQPYLYTSNTRDSRLPEKEFDPKAITRASWEPVPKKPKQNGPLVSFNRHPDAHEVLPGRTYANFRPMSDRAKWWIKWTRYFQLAFRAIELLAAAGLLALMILIDKVQPLTAWILRIAPGIIILCNAYAILHLAKPARARPPASSAAYQLFAGITDLAIVSIYAFGGISVAKESEKWDTLLVDKSYIPWFIKGEYYGLIGAGGLHLISLGISLYLGLAFKRIANMPPDMNPLESNLTSRAKHKRSKSSIASDYTSVSQSTKRLSTPLEDYRRSGAPYETLSRPPSIPFMHTRSGSQDSMSSSKRDSRVDLPSRQYQVVPSNSPRHSQHSLADEKRMSTPKLAQRGSYMEVPLHEAGSPARPASRPSSVAITAASQPTNSSPTRIAKFTEKWYASDSLVTRTQQRNRAMDASERSVAERAKAYEALSQPYGDDDSGDEHMRPGDASEYSDDKNDGPIGNMHPNPLRYNPVISTPPRSSASNTPRQKTPFRPHDSAPVLGEVSSNARRVSGSQDIADANSAPTPGRRGTIIGNWGRNKGLRNSSIQHDDQFYSKPYGDLKSATPPIMVGENANLTASPRSGNGRQVSSGNDYDLGSGSNKGYRRNVSGKAAEEGMAGPGTSRFSRYGPLDE
ncbi:hypothetical protein GGR57DRAFT_195260 [Xylariaceae sp. FL1272]|nr:hypothetical protein GGR57DRAFT_195260 [Xylariaceae sp. FL1272]